MNTLILDTIAIKQDTFGRYCLNDLHKASGGEKKHQPSDFLGLDSTHCLIMEMVNSGDSRSCDPAVSTPGRYGGTFVCKELVYAATLVAAGAALRYVDQP